MPNGRDERVAVSYISIHRESDPPVFLPPPLGGIPLNRWSLIDRPAKKSEGCLLPWTKQSRGHCAYCCMSVVEYGLFIAYVRHYDQ